MTDFIPREKGVPIRFPSEANLLVDSSDRGDFINPQGTPGNFSIYRPSNLLNGFFTRITPTELALDWRVPNVGPFASTSDASFNRVQVDISGATTVDTYNTILPTGCYNCSDVLDYWLGDFNAATGNLFTISVLGNMNVAITGKDGSGVDVYWRFSGGPSVNALMGSLGFPTLNGLPSNPFAFVQTNETNGGTNNGNSGYFLSKYKYIDFVSPQLTNQQDVKDGTTSKFFNQNSLYRWYLATTNDSPPNVDKYGFPIYPTNKQFFIRRDLANPKFIKWEANVPIGNLDFQVYATRWFPQDITNPGTWTTLLDRNPDGSPYPFSWMMTLQASEV